MINQDVGFILLKLDNSPAYNVVLDTIYKFIEDRPFNQFVIFNSQCDKTDTRNIPILHVSHAQFFTGNLVLFDIASAIMSKAFTNVKNRFLYATDTPWTVSSKNRYYDWLEIYSNKNLEIIVANNSLYDIYNIVWKQPTGISENFNYEQIKNIL